MQFGALQQRGAWAADCRASGKVGARRYETEWLLCPLAAAELLRQHDGGTGAKLAKPDANLKQLLKEALTSVSGDDWSRQRPAVVAAAGGGPSAQATRHRDAVRQAAQLAAECASKAGIIDVLDLSQRAAARGIVGAVMGSTEHASLDSASRASREQVERLLIGFICASRVPRSVRDPTECDRLETALMRAVEEQADHFTSESEAVAAAPHARTSAVGVGNHTCKETPSAGSLDQASTPAPVISGAQQPNTVAPPAFTATVHSSPSPEVPGAASSSPADGPTAAAKVVLSRTSALLPRLLAQPALRRSEAVCNANSCLLAGFETTYLLIACSLLHLAQAPHVQEQARAALKAAAATATGPGACATAATGSVSSAVQRSAAAAAAPPLIGAILRETLRVNPPVSGLPRRVVAPEGIQLSLRPAEGGDGGSGGGGDDKGCEDCARAGMLQLPPGFAFSVDLIAAAHGWRQWKADQEGPPEPADANCEASADSVHADVGGFCCPALLSTLCRSGSAHRRYAVKQADSSSAGTGGGGVGVSTGRNGAGSAPNWDPTSWVWDPLRPAPPVGCRDRYAEAAPFGIGPRSCPAGSLSMLIAREVLCALLPRFGWRLARPEVDRHWNSRTVTVPTLAIRGPIPLSFEAVAA